MRFPGRIFLGRQGWERGARPGKWPEIGIWGLQSDVESGLDAFGIQIFYGTPGGARFEGKPIGSNPYFCVMCFLLLVDYSVPTHIPTPMLVCLAFEVQVPIVLKCFKPLSNIIKIGGSNTCV